MCNELRLALENERRRLMARKKACESHIAYMEHLSTAAVYHGTADYRDERDTLDSLNDRLESVDKLLNASDL